MSDYGMKITWTSFKIMLDLGIPFKEIVLPGSIKLLAIDGDSKFQTIIHTDGDMPTEYAEYQADYAIDKNRIVELSKAFADKILPCGKKIFKRVHGVKITVEDVMVPAELVIPYDDCKITGVELLAGVYGDNVNFKVYDTPTGTLSTIPNSMLNQFGFGVYVAKDIHTEMSNYDADLIKDLKIEVEYTPKNTGVPRDVYVNFILHEVK